MMDCLRRRHSPPGPCSSMAVVAACFVWHADGADGLARRLLAAVVLRCSAAARAKGGISLRVLAGRCRASARLWQRAMR